LVGMGCSCPPFCQPLASVIDLATMQASPQGGSLCQLRSADLHGPELHQLHPVAGCTRSGTKLAHQLAPMQAERTKGGRGRLVLQAAL
jgi:hypothetical protein